MIMKNDRKNDHKKSTAPDHLDDAPENMKFFISFVKLMFRPLFLSKSSPMNHMVFGLSSITFSNAFGFKCTVLICG